MSAAGRSAERTDVMAVVPVDRREWEISSILPSSRQRLIQSYMTILLRQAREAAKAKGRRVTSLQAVSATPADEAEEREMFPGLDDPAAFVLMRARFATSKV